MHAGEEDHARLGLTTSRRGRLSVEESVRMTEDRDKWRKYVHVVANPRIEDGKRTEQNSGWCDLNEGFLVNCCVLCCLLKVQSRRVVTVLRTRRWTRLVLVENRLHQN